MRNKEIEELLKQIDRDVQGNIKEPASKVIKLLLPLKDDIESYENRKTIARKSQDSARHKPKRDYDKRLRWLEKGRLLNTLTEQEYERKKQDIENVLNLTLENLEKKEGPKGKENLQLNYFVEILHYILITYAGYSPTSKAPNTIANLLNLCNIAKDKGNEFNRIDVNSIIDRNLKPDYRSHIKPLVDDLLKPISE